MITLRDLGLKLIPIVDAALTTHRKEKQLIPLQHTIYNSQMAIYWLREANEDLKLFANQEGGGIESTESEREQEVATNIPTMFTIQDYLKYMTSELAELVKDTDEFMKTSYLPEGVLYKVQRGYDKIHESLFNTELAVNYYEQLTGHK